MISLRGVLHKCVTQHNRPTFLLLLFVCRSLYQMSTNPKKLLFISETNRDGRYLMLLFNIRARIPHARSNPFMRRSVKIHKETGGTD